MLRYNVATEYWRVGINIEESAGKKLQGINVRFTTLVFLNGM